MARGVKLSEPIVIVSVIASIVVWLIYLEVCGIMRGCVFFERVFCVSAMLFIVHIIAKMDVEWYVDLFETYKASSCAYTSNYINANVSTDTFDENDKQRMLTRTTKMDHMWSYLYDASDLLISTLPHDPMRNKPILAFFKGVVKSASKLNVVGVGKKLFRAIYGRR